MPNSRKLARRSFSPRCADAMVRTAAASSSSAGNQGAGDRPADALRDALGTDEVRYGGGTFKISFSARFGEKHGDGQLYCAYHGSWHDREGFSAAQRLAPRATRYCQQFSAPSARQSARPCPTPSGASCARMWNTKLSTLGKQRIAAQNGDGNAAEEPHKADWDSIDEENEARRTGKSLQEMKEKVTWLETARHAPRLHASFRHAPPYQPCWVDRLHACSSR